MKAAKAGVLAAGILLGAMAVPAVAQSADQSGVGLPSRSDWVTLERLEKSLSPAEKSAIEKLMTAVLLVGVGTGFFGGWVCRKIS